MIIERTPFYFEPRVVSDTATIRWYGDRYYHDALSDCYQATVYIRDNGKELFVYQLKEDTISETQISAIFTLVCKIEKSSTKYIYGKLNQNEGAS